MRRAIRNACENRTDRGEPETVPHFISQERPCRLVLAEGNYKLFIKSALI